MGSFSLCFTRENSWPGPRTGPGGQQLADHAGAAAAAGRRPGRGPGLLEVGAGPQPTRADAGAGAHLGVVGQRRGAVAGRPLGQQQLTRLVRAEHGAPVVELGDQADPGQVADQDGGLDDAVADDQLAVRPGDRVGHLDDLAVGPLGLAEHGDVQAGGTQPRDDPRPGVRRVVAGQAVGQHLGLLPGRRHEAGGPPGVLGAVADRVDPPVGDRLEVPAVDDAAATGQPSLASQCGRGPTSGGEHDQVGVQGEAVVETEPLVGEPDRPRSRVDLGAELPQPPSEDRSATDVDLAREQVLGALDDLGGDAAHGQRPGDLEPEQAAADDHGCPGRGHRAEQPQAVVQRPERVHLGMQRPVHPHQAADRRQRRDRAGC